MDNVVSDLYDDIKSKSDEELDKYDKQIDLMIKDLRTIKESNSNMVGDKNE